MDEHLRRLQRSAMASGDLEILSQYFRALKATGLRNSLNYFLELRHFLISMFPPEFDDLDEVSVELATTPLVNLAREVSSFIFNGGFDYLRNQFMPTFDYENPPSGASSWAVIEFLETKFVGERVRNRLVAMTGVYLVDTGMAWHLASLERSSRLIELYPNIIDVVRQDFSELESDWYSPLDDKFINRHMLRNAINWHWITQEEVSNIDIEDLSPEQQEEAIEEGLQEIYHCNHVI